MKNLKETKLNNKGFSLVELIIVIAIMAVLIGVLAPQYLKYVDRSRESADISTVDAMISAVEVYSSDPANTAVSGKLECSATGEIQAEADVLAALKDAGLAGSADAVTTTLATMKSTTCKKAWTATFSSTGVTISDTTIAEKLGRN